jgi:hypothetical protein
MTLFYNYLLFLWVWYRLKIRVIVTIKYDVVTIIYDTITILYNVVTIKYELYKLYICDPLEHASITSFHLSTIFYFKLFHFFFLFHIKHIPLVNSNTLAKKRKQ